YGVTRLIKQGLETQASFQAEVQSRGKAILAERDTNLDSLLSQLTSFTEQLQQRTQAITTLDDRVSRLEVQAITAPSTPEAPGADLRLTAVEQSLGSVELLAGELGQRSDTLIAINERITNVEELLKTLSSLPDVIGQQNQVLANFEERLNQLEAAHLANSEVQIHAVEPDRGL
ncbi:hypothetical protein H6F43_20210, partial [Leptolyngbya sp. FACHB-36]|uniref:hypothetical protein n=1 Tax=Leptolyngbya sp. FACHB-36 TaxID=2692808 RepID=UPI0016808D45